MAPARHEIRNGDAVGRDRGLREQAEPHAPPAWSAARDLRAVEQHPPARGSQEARQSRAAGRLAAGVGAYDRREGAGRDRDRQVAHHDATFSQNAFYDGLIYAYPDGLATDFLTMLGFKINPKLTPLIERGG